MIRTGGNILVLLVVSCLSALTRSKMRLCLPIWFGGFPYNEKSSSMTLLIANGDNNISGIRVD